MIKVLYGIRDDRYVYLSVKGHANFADYGEDLICAGVSSIVFGFMNALDALNLDVQIKDNSNHIEIINNTDDSVVQNYYELVMIQLKTIEESYSEFIKVERKNNI